MKPEVSIIAPTYNHEKYIAQCIESVLKQSFRNWEMIIVNDASTDRTKEIIAAYARNDPRITVIDHLANYGPGRLGELHNQALAMSQGDFVTVIEGDDYWPEQRLEEQLRSFESTRDAVLVHGRMIEVVEGTESEINNPYPDEIRLNDPKGMSLKAFLMGEDPVFAPSVMVKKSALVNIGGFQQIPSLFLVDYPTYMNLAFEGRFGFIEKPLGFWRRHASSITATHQEKLWIGYIDYAAVFISNNRERILAVGPGMADYIDNNSYNAYQALCAIYLRRGDRTSARRMIGELLKRKSMAVEAKHILRLASLTAGAYITPGLFKTAEGFNKKLKNQ